MKFSIIHFMFGDDAKAMLEKLPMASIVEYMDDDIREEIHRDFAPCSPEKFLENYMARHFEKYGEEFAIN